MQPSKRLVRIDDTRAMELTTYTPEPSEPAYPAFDTAKPTDAERIAELEARVAALEDLTKTLLARADMHSGVLQVVMRLEPYIDYLGL